jgi:hypothetical protein
LDLSLVPAALDVCPDQFIIEPFQVERKLSAINSHKSNGPDELPNWVLCNFSRWLAEPICAIYNASLRQGEVPAAWKCANVVPVPKVKAPTAIQTDLRPISLTPTLSKILESFIGNWILDEMREKIDSKQFGALKGRSTTHELVDILHHWLRALDNHESVRIVFFDYAKAYDHVDHTVLIGKMQKLGISSTLLRWVCSFLYNRKHGGQDLRYCF